MSERSRPVEDGDELTTLTSMLDFLRATVTTKVEDLSDEQAFAAPGPPSTPTLAGLVKHLSATERFWFSIDFAGLDLVWPYPEGDPKGGFPIEEATLWRRSSPSTNGSAMTPGRPSPVRTWTTRPEDRT